MKKLMLGLMMAFAVTAEAMTIDGIDYGLDMEAKTATICGYNDFDTPLTTIDVGEVEWGGERYTVTSVGNRAFSDCGLTSVSLPNVTTIGEWAFDGCKLLESVSLPLATTIGDSVFYQCGSLTSVSFPNATTIGDSAFYQCGSLTSVSFPNATTIGRDAFDGCPLTEISLPNARTIGDLAFFKCSSLASVSLPNVTEIGNDAFRDCENLKEVSLPSVTTIGYSAFSGCQGLSSLLINAEMKKEIEDKGKGAYCIPQAATITYYDGLPYSVVEAAVYRMAVISGDKAIDEAEYKRSCDLLHLTPKEKPQVVKEGEIAVKKESIQAAKAETISIANNEIQLGVSVMSNANITAEIANWGKVNLSSENVKVENGNVVITIPVDSASGFIILQSKDAKIETAE